MTPPSVLTQPFAVHVSPGPQSVAVSQMVPVRPQPDATRAAARATGHRKLFKDRMDRDH
jgi:hypothetical protein